MRRSGRVGRYSQLLVVFAAFACVPHLQESLWAQILAWSATETHDHGPTQVTLAFDLESDCFLREWTGVMDFTMVSTVTNPVRQRYPIRFAFPVLRPDEPWRMRWYDDVAHIQWFAELSGNTLTLSNIPTSANADRWRLSGPMQEVAVPDDRRRNVPREFTLVLVLHDAGLVPFTQRLVGDLTQIWNPIVRSARRELNIIVEQMEPISAGDMTLEFQSTGADYPPCSLSERDPSAALPDRLDLYGEAAGGVVFVGRLRAGRICGERGDPRDPSYGSRMERVFDDDNPEDLVDAVANTATHELGHMIGDLADITGHGNYMSWPSVEPPRTRVRVIQELSGPKSFDDEQRRQLTCAIMTGRYATLMRVTRPH